MKATELRLGNYVYNMDGLVFPIKSLTNELNGDMDIVCGINGARWSEYHPIPLTEKWLIALGFRKLENSLTYCIDEFWISFDFSPPECGDYLGSHNLRSVKYVHELQNLYFALTGEELIYTQEGGI